MDLQELQQLLDNKLLLSGISAICGGLIGSFIAAYRNRIKTLQYTVSHDRVGLSSNDKIFGNVTVSWQGHELTNLYSSVVTITNDTSTDYTALRLKVYTGSTLLLTERTEIRGTTSVLKWTPEFSNTLQVANGATPTTQQMDIYRHQREYVLPVLNRGQAAIIHLLTTVPNQNDGPGVWVDMQHPGVQVEYKRLMPEIHGVPVKLALPLGLLSSIGIFLLVSTFCNQIWIASLVTLVVGLAAQSIGAWIYRIVHALKKVFLR